MPRRAPEIEQLVHQWLDHKQAARGEGIRARLADYDGVLAIGTERGEWWSGTEAFAAAHTSGGPFRASVEVLEAHQEGAFAWASVRAAIETGDPETLPIRLTLVLLQEDGDWRIVHSHASAPESD